MSHPISHNIKLEYLSHLPESDEPMLREQLHYSQDSFLPCENFYHELFLKYVLVPQIPLVEECGVV
jgi:hypothetical protein